MFTSQNGTSAIPDSEGVKKKNVAEVTFSQDVPVASHVMVAEEVASTCAGVRKTAMSAPPAKRRAGKSRVATGVEVSIVARGRCFGHVWSL